MTDHDFVTRGIADRPDTGRALWVLAPGEAALRETPLPDPAEGLVRVRTVFSAISRGTESLVFNGRVPPSQHEAMRAPFQEGAFGFPVKYGYAAVGRVEDGLDELLGRLVFCLYPHQTRFVVPATALVPVPASVPAGRAVLGANMETALNALWDAPVRPGDRVVVLGAGTVGLALARLAAAVPASRVTLVDPDPAKAAPAHALGLAIVDSAEGLGDADLVFEASGAPAALADALGIAGDEATVVALGWYGDAPVPLPLGEAFHSRRLTLLSSQVGKVAGPRRARRTHADRLALALELLADPAFDALISGESPFDDLPETLARLAADGRGVVTHRIRYPAADTEES
ncbi:MAG: zinc-binding alcohol dehydrogenase [Azospirillaceae bacterium]